MALFDDTIGGDFSLGNSNTFTQNPSGQQYLQRPQALQSLNTLPDTSFNNIEKPKVDLSGKIDRPSFLELIPYAIGGAGAVLDRKQRLINERALPVMKNLIQAGGDALRKQDWDTVDQVSTGLSNLAGQAPQFAEQAKAFTNTINEKRKDIESNKTLLDLAKQQVGDNPRMQAGIGFLNSRIATLGRKEMQDAITTLYPQLDISEGRIQGISKSGELDQPTIRPVTLKVGDLTQEQHNILTQLNVKETDYVNFINRYDNNKPVTKNEIESFGVLRQQIQQQAQLKEGIARVPGTLQASQAGIPVGQVAGFTGTQPGGPQQAQMQGSTPQPGIAPQQQMRPPGPVQQAQQLPQTGNTPPGTLWPSGQANPTLSGQQSIPGPTVTPPQDYSPEEINRYQREQKAAQVYQENVSKNAAERLTRPLGDQQLAVQMNKYGEIKRAPAVMPEDFARRTNWHIVGQPTQDAKDINSYSQLQNQGVELSQAIKSLPEDVLSSNVNLAKAMEKIIASGVSFPVRIPLLGSAGFFTISVPGMGAVTLSPVEAELYTKLTAFAQASKDAINPGDPDNKYIESIKALFTGAFTRRDLALAGIKAAVETGRDKIAGTMKQSGAVAPQEPDPRLQYTPKNTESLTSAVGKTIKANEENFSKGMPYPTAESLNKLVDTTVNILTGQGVEGEMAKKFVNSLVKSSPQVTGALLNSIGSVTGINRLIEGFKSFQAEYDKRQQDIAERKRQSRIPINSTTLKSLNDIANQGYSIR